jgi:hypothetical protein
MSIEELRRLMKEPFKSFGDPDKARDNPIDILHSNAKKLFEEYDGDPRKLLADDVLQTLRNITHGKNGRKFIQYGQGKATLLLKNYVRFGIWPFSEFDIPIKIDRHNMRIMLGTGVIVPPEDMERGRTDHLIKRLRELFWRVTRNERISAVDLNDGVWAIGSYLCVKNDAVHCHLSCSLGCYSRPQLEERGSYYFPQLESRRDADNLFAYAVQSGKK